MAKKIILIFIIIFSFSCERDDICIDPITPNLIVVFYDNTDQSERKVVDKLKVEIDSLGTFIEINQSVKDSIIIPLRIDVDFTKIRLTKNLGESNQKIDNFTLNYLREDVFVSRSCGYKTIFLETTKENVTNNWMNSLIINNQTIADETAKHISIFH